VASHRHRLEKHQHPGVLVEMLRFWLLDRVLLTGEEMAARPMTCGVPQVSVLGPVLWNFTYDSLLIMDVPPGVKLVGFADNLAVVGIAVTGQQLRDKINTTLRGIDDWMVS